MHPHVLYPCGSIISGCGSNKIESFCKLVESIQPAQSGAVYFRNVSGSLHVTSWGISDIKWSAMTRDDRNSQGQTKQKRQQPSITPVCQAMLQQTRSAMLLLAHNQQHCCCMIRSNHVASTSHLSHVLESSHKAGRRKTLQSSLRIQQCEEGIP